MDFRSLFTRKSKSSEIATQRLQLILTQDRFEVGEDSMKKTTV